MTEWPLARSRSADWPKIASLFSGSALYFAPSFSTSPAICKLPSLPFPPLFFFTVHACKHYFICTCFVVGANVCTHRVVRSKIMRVHLQWYKLRTITALWFFFFFLNSNIRSCLVCNTSSERSRATKMLEGYLCYILESSYLQQCIFWSVHTSSIKKKN